MGGRRTWAIPPDQAIFAQADARAAPFQGKGRPRQTPWKTKQFRPGDAMRARKTWGKIWRPTSRDHRFQRTGGKKLSSRALDAQGLASVHERQRGENRIPPAVFTPRSPTKRARWSSFGDAGWAGLPYQRKPWCGRFFIPIGKAGFRSKGADGSQRHTLVRPLGSKKNGAGETAPHP